MPSRWSGSGPSYVLTWGRHPWTLTVDAEHPGLTSDSPRFGSLLALDGISSTDRDDPAALSGGSLVDHGCRFDRVEALYVPDGWHSLRVRATWTPRDHGILDLEIQLQANTVDELQAVQAHVRSDFEPASSTAGRAGPLVSLRHDPDTYLEMSHPDDTAGRVVDATRGVRYGLFGYDLERGVVLRGRLRGVWLEKGANEAEVASRFDRFLREPLPLGT